ncbi:MAG: TonB-dependent receptor [Chitinophagaceae bacterium]|nr:TonB-dependent receptor [Chitinophagaceae bacterium]
MINNKSSIHSILWIINNSKSKTALCLLLIANCLLPIAASAQKDTLKKTSTVDINSAYKPVLRNAVKINFSATHLNADTTAPGLTYSIPAQNLFYAYQPIPLSALALQQDTNLYLGLRNYVKAGYGNLATPHVSAGFSFGDGKKFLANVYADYISSKGKLLYQDYSRLNLKAAGSLFLPTNEVYAGVQVKMHENFLYGFDTGLYKYSKKDVRQQFQDFSGTIGIRNTKTGEFGINYNPSLQVSSFTNVNKLTETSFILTAPVEKKFGEIFAFKLDVKADITSYATKNLLPADVKFNNNVFQVSPSVVFSTPRASINAGITPTWDNGKFIWLPNVYAEAFIAENTFAFQAGWVGRLTKNTYRNLSEVNPYLKTFTAQMNTKEIEYYGGIKGTLGKHFNFNAKAGYITYNNLPLLINDTATDGKAFIISNETRINNFRVHGDVSFVSKEKLTVSTGITYNGYVGMKSNAKAWNTLPLEFTSSLRWWAFKQVLLKADFYAFSGSFYLDKGNVAKAFKPGSDLSAGIEFKINKTFSAWMDVNNILNNKYQRWHNYEVYGLNLMGGVRVNF